MHIYSCVVCLGDIILKLNRTYRKVFPGVCSPGFLASLCSIYRLNGIEDEVLHLQCLHEICVPHFPFVIQLYNGEGGGREGERERGERREREREKNGGEVRDGGGRKKGGGRFSRSKFCGHFYSTLTHE